MTTTTWNPDTYPVVFINNENHLSALAAKLAKATRVAVDTETHAAVQFEDGLWAALRVISIALKMPDDSYEAYVIDVRDMPSKPLSDVMATITMADAWNANFDDRVLDLAGCNVQEWRDAMLSDGLLHSGASGFEFWHGLAFAAKKYLGVDLAGKGTTQTSYDGTSDLTEEQIRYPGFDALVTLRVAEHIDNLVTLAGLDIPVNLEQKARPFILEMTKRGIPFQMPLWREKVLAEHIVGLKDAQSELASLTGGSDSNLFGESENPTWNPDSDAQAREALNTWATDAVKAFTGGRLLAKTDKLDKTALKQIKHPITEALLRYRNHAKLLSTYGENLEGFVGADGRIRPRYKQGGVVATGRLASDKPNAQNFSPLMKSYFRPSDEVDQNGVSHKRVFVYADLSQAELRVIAQVSNDERMRGLFRMGGDFHARTAADMFEVDMDSLKESDPVAHGNNRKKAKGVNFGIPYGLGAAALATNLTVNSKLLTSPAEAAAMLKKYGETYPEVNKWLSERDMFVRSLAKKTGDVNWDLSFKLMDLHKVVVPLARTMKKKLGRPASATEISMAMISDDALRSSSKDGATSLTDLRAEHVASVSWASGFDAAVVLTNGGEPWSFESRTLTGRRRLFTVPMDSSTKDKFEGILTSAMLTICTSDKERVCELRKRFADMHKLTLPVGFNRCPKKAGESTAEFKARNSAPRRSERVACVKTFEGANKRLKYDLVKYISDHMGADAVKTHLLPAAMEDQIRSYGNRFRNHPIQSLVADIGLQYYGTLRGILSGYRNAFPVQAVHDSIAIECDMEDAPRLVLEVKKALEDALSTWCPDVPSVADADIRLSLSDEDVVSIAEVESALRV